MEKTIIVETQGKNTPAIPSPQETYIEGLCAFVVLMPLLVFFAAAYVYRLWHKEGE